MNFKKVYRIISQLFLFSVCAGAQSSIIPAHPSQLKYDSLRWSIPSGEPYRTVLSNGLRAYIATDSTLPLVEISGCVRYGSLFDPRGKEGLSGLSSTLIRSGGVEKIPADTLDKIIAQKAMQFSFSIGDDMCSFRASFLSEYTDTAFSLLQQMLFAPAYEQKKIDQQKAIYIEAIRHRFDNPGPTLSFAYEKAMYPNAINSRNSTEKSIGAITRNDLLQMHRKYFQTGNMIIAVAGSFDRKNMVSRLEKLFPKSGTVSDTTFPSIVCKPVLKSLVVNKAISQAYVRIGMPLFKRPHDDYYPVMVLNEIFGGGSFTSRLSSKIRSDEGLTYSIYSSAESNYTFPGTWNITFFTKTESFSKATKLIFNEIDTLVKNGISDEELRDIKSVLLSELPSMFRSPFDIVSTYAQNEYYGRAPDHYKKYTDAIGKMTKTDLDNVAKKYLQKDNFTVTVVGDTSALLKAGDTLFDITKRIPLKAIETAALPELQ